MRPLLAPFESTCYAALRFVAGFLMLFHGLQKLFGLFGGNVVEALTQRWFGGLIELICGVMVAVGFFTSPAAFLLSGTMAVAYFQFHQPGGLLPIQNRGELAALYCFVYLFIAARGTGRFGIDKH
ncbi:MAG: DoxX family protein [Acidobacteria bacterium]|nr:DoxX family protein [Acidobacteriota bacterium]